MDMDPIETVHAFLARASRLLHPQSTAIPSLPSESLVASLVTIRAMLERMAKFTPSESDISAFCILASLENIRLLLESRRHPECAQVDSWSNIILADLSKFASKVMLNTTHSRPLMDSTLGRALSRMYLEACSQLPVLWESCIASFGRQETSPTARVVLLRLLYLATVLQPRLSHSSPHGSLVESLSRGIPLQIGYLLQGSPFLLHDECLALTIGLVVELDTNQYKAGFPLEHHSYQLYVIAGVLELLPILFQDHQATALTSQSLFTQTSLVAWFFRTIDAADTRQSITFQNLVASWLRFASEQGERWDNIVLPALQASPRVAMNACGELLKNHICAHDVPCAILLGPIVRCLLSFTTLDAFSVMDSAQRSGQFETLAVLFFHLEDHHSHVRRDIVKYLFWLHQDSIKDSEWQRLAYERTLTQLENSIGCGDVLEQHGNLLVAFLVCLLHRSTLAQTPDDRLRNVCKLLLGRAPSDVSDWILRQNTLILCSHVEGSARHPLLAHLPEHLDDFLRATLSACSLEHYARTFIQYISLLAGRSLLHKCLDDQICTVFQVLLDIIFLVIQEQMECDQEMTNKLIAEVCEVLTAVLAAASDSAVEYLAASPWCFTLRLELKQRMDKGDISRAQEICFLLKKLEQITAGVRMEGEKSVRERRLKMKEIDGDFIVFFVE